MMKVFGVLVLSVVLASSASADVGAGRAIMSGSRGAASAATRGVGQSGDKVEPKKAVTPKVEPKKAEPKKIAAPVKSVATELEELRSENRKLKAENARLEAKITELERNR